MADRPRYRKEGEHWCVDMRMRTARQLFDGRDPAPFRERDLDEDAVDYVVAAVEELPAKQPLRIVLHIADRSADPDLGADIVVAAMRSHFSYEHAQVGRKMRTLMRHGRTILAIALVALVALLSLAALATNIPNPYVSNILREGLTITGWVAMWRPLEHLLYDWWPHHDRRKLLLRVVASDIVVRYGGSDGEPPSLP